MLIGTVQEPVAFTFGAVQPSEVEFTCTFVYTREEVEMYLGMLAAGKIAFPEMVTDIVSLGEVKEKGFDRSDMSSQRKILIRP